jgi:AcrR family transcriptional regulator
VGADAGDYEQILRSAMLLFNERGYHDTAMDDIAAAVGISTTSIYRLFTGKGAILATVYRRAADRVSGDLSDILASADGSRDAVEQLAEAFVRRSFANPELAYVYYAERLNVPAEDQVALHDIQRATVDGWARQVAATRPEIPLDEARFVVHAGFALVVDLGPVHALRQLRIIASGRPAPAPHHLDRHAAGWRAKSCRSRRPAVWAEDLVVNVALGHTLRQQRRSDAVHERQWPAQVRLGARSDVDVIQIDSAGTDLSGGLTRPHVLVPPVHDG